MENISSCSIINQRTTGLDTDNFLSLGSAVMVRKFDPDIVVSGSWNEAWIGMRCRVNNKYNYTKSVIQNVWPGTNNHSSFGFCKYSGAVYGESGSANFSNTNISHSMYIQLETWDELDIYGSFNRTRGSSIGYVNVTGSKNSNTGVNDTIELNFTENPTYRDILMFRFVTGSSAIKWVVNTLTASSSFNDISSSAQLADLMKCRTWTIAVASASKHGMYGSSLSGEMTANRSINGYFDATFISWEARFQPLEISEIVYKFI